MNHVREPVMIVHDHPELGLPVVVVDGASSTASNQRTTSGFSGSPALLTTRSLPFTRVAASGPAAISIRYAVGEPARLVMPSRSITSYVLSTVKPPSYNVVA